jgi:dsRNA-specific ribonuclease
LRDNVSVANSKYQDAIIDITGDAYKYLQEDAKANWKDSWGRDGISQATKVNDEAKKVFSEYLKYAGLEGQGYELVDTTGNDKNRKFVYKDAEGK